MSKLKPGWRHVKFGDVVRLNKETSKQPLAEGLDRYVGLEHLEPGDLRIRSWGNVADGTTFTNRFRPGHVLFGKRRAYQRKVAVADFDGVCSGDIYVLESKDSAVLLPELLPFICQTDAFFEHAVGTSAGSLSPRTNWKSLAGYEFALPPLEEQRRIARLLSAANPAAEPPPLQELEAVASALWLKELALGERLGSRQIKPSSWPGVSSTAELGQLVTDSAPICYGIVLRGDHVSSGVPALTISDLGSDYSQAYRVSAEIDESYSRSRIQPGDLIPAIKATIGPIDIVPEGFSGNIQRQLARIRIDPEAPVLARFVYRLWSSPLYQRYLSSLTVGSTRAELSIGTLKALEVPILEPQKQADIVSVLDELDTQRRLLISRWERSRGLFSCLVNTQLSGAAS